MPSDETPNIVPNFAAAAAVARFALVMEQPLKRGRRQVDGESEFLPHDLGRKVHIGDPAKYVRHEINALEGFCVAAQRHFVVGPAVDVVENRARQTALGQMTEIVEIVTIGQAHVFSFSTRACHTAA